jgi:hypothetical protein
MHVFLGITGAPYAARLLDALSAADCEIGVCAARLLEHAPNGLDNAVSKRWGQ